MAIHPTHFPLHLFPVSSQHVFFYSRGKHQQHCLLLGCEDWVLVYKASGLRMHCMHIKSHYYSHDLEKPLRSSWKSPVLTMAAHWKKFFLGGGQLLGKNLKKKRVIRKERFILTHDLRIEEVSQGKKAWCQQLEAPQQLRLQSERR